MDIPAQYKWLENEPGPGMITEALKLFGTQEVLGEKNNPVILAWVQKWSGNVKQVYSGNKQNPWCGLFAWPYWRRDREMKLSRTHSGHSTGALLEFLLINPCLVMCWPLFARLPMVKRRDMLRSILARTIKPIIHWVATNRIVFCVTRMAKTRLPIHQRRPNYTIHLLISERYS